MSKRMSILLIVLTIVSGLIGGAITGRIFAVKPAMADEAKKTEKTLGETIKELERTVLANKILILTFAGLMDSQKKSLTTQEIKVVDENGKLLMKLGKPKADVNRYGLAIYDNSGNARTILSVDESGGSVIVGGNDGKISASMGVGESGGSVIVNNREGKAGVSMGVIESGGIVCVSGKDDKAGAMMSIMESGGSVYVTGKDGKASMDIFENGGAVYVTGKDGKTGAGMYVSDTGGAVRVSGKGSDEDRATMQVNEYGNGAIGLWDKNGYRLR